MLKFRPIDPERRTSFGRRCLDAAPLTADEIGFLKDEIRAIGADISIFIFNDPAHIKSATCYDIPRDVIYVTRDAFPNVKWLSPHPRDLMSPRAVLAHEYYGRRLARKRYLSESGGSAEPLPVWKDEAYASINAALRAPNLRDWDRLMLVNYGAMRAQEACQQIEMTAELREILDGKWDPSDRAIALIERIVIFRGMGSQEANDGGWQGRGQMP